MWHFHTLWLAPSMPLFLSFLWAVIPCPHKDEEIEVQKGSNDTPGCRGRAQLRCSKMKRHRSARALRWAPLGPCSGQQLREPGPHEGHSTEDLRSVGPYLHRDCQLHPWDTWSPREASYTDLVAGGFHCPVFTPPPSLSIEKTFADTACVGSFELPSHVVRSTYKSVPISFYVNTKCYSMRFNFLNLYDLSLCRLQACHAGGGHQGSYSCLSRGTTGQDSAKLLLLTGEARPPE